MHNCSDNYCNIIIDLSVVVCYTCIMKCDLHLHSSCSDGALTPEQLVQRAQYCQLQCIALTDHDTLAGVARAQMEGGRLGVQVLSGVELSTVSGNKEVHILVFGLDCNDQHLISEMHKISSMRNNRNTELVARLAQHGMPIDLQAIVANSHGSVGRPAIANEMVRLGYVSSVVEAFEKYIGKGKSCYVQTARLSPQDAISLAQRYGAVSVLAHPRNLRMSPSQCEQFVAQLVGYGLDGIESMYFSHTKTERKFYNKLARKYNLLVTGGSDYHDDTHGIQLGSMSIHPEKATILALGIR